MNLIRGVFLIICAVYWVGCATGERTRLSDRERALLLLNIANAALSENDPDTALQNLFQAEQLDPKNSALFHSKALAFHAKNRTSAAIEAARRAVHLSPKNLYFKNTLGQFLFEAGKGAEAIGHLQSAGEEKFNSESYKALTTLGIIYFKRGQIEKASEYFDKAILEAPELACVAHFQKGQISLDKRDYANAAKHFKNATQFVCNSYSEAHLNLGLSYFKQGSFAKARKTLLEVSQRFPGTNQAEKAMAMIHEIPVGQN